MRRHIFELELRGQECSIELALVPPDDSVGLMGYSFEDEVITDENGALVDWELTEAEIEKIHAVIDDYTREG